MIQRAKVVEISDGHAVVQVSRKAMCDGCHKSECGGSCAMSAIFANGSTMTATAVNEAGAVVGDTVEIETSDKEVLGVASLVFLLPVVLGGVLYAAGSLLKLSSEICTAMAVAGFVAVFPFLRIVEKIKRRKGPRLFVIRVVNDNEYIRDESAAD